MSAFSAYLNYLIKKLEHREFQMMGGSKSGRTYDREDVRGLVSDVVEFFAVFGAFCVAGDDIVGDTLELLEGEADGTLMSPVQLHLPTYMCEDDTHILLVEVFLLHRSQNLHQTLRSTRITTTTRNAHSR